MEWSRILVRATNWVGDAVISLPAMRALRARFPYSHLAVLARPWVAGLYRRESFYDELLPCPTGRWRLARELRAGRFDCAVLLPNAFDSALVAWMAGIPERIGYARDGRGFLLTRAVRPPEPGDIPPHERYFYLELLRRAGVVEDAGSSGPICLEGAGAARQEGSKLFQAMGFDGPVVGLSPGAQNSRAKQWLPERFAEAACALSGTLGACVAIFGSTRERMLGLFIAESIRRAGRPVLNLAGETTLEQFIALAAACRVFLTNDSGSMHVASALGVPTVAVFGPTIVEATGPAGPRSVVVCEPVECSPCMLRDCPIDHRCMRGITAPRVAEAALNLLK